MPKLGEHESVRPGVEAPEIVVVLYGLTNAQTVASLQPSCTGLLVKLIKCAGRKRSFHPEGGPAMRFSFPGEDNVWKTLPPSEDSEALSKIGILQ
jgi:hypothetical protein